MVQADEILLTELVPLFSPTSVASALTALQQRGESFLLSSSPRKNIQTLYSTSNGCRSARSQFMLATLVALRKRVAESPRHLIKKWCNSVASRTSIEIQLRNEEMKIKKTYLSSEEDEKEEARKLQQQLGRDVSFTEVIEIPCLLLLCAFAVTYLPGIECVATRNEIFTDAVKLAQVDGDLIVRDDVTLEEVIEFGLDVAGTARSRWLPTNQRNRHDENNYLGVKVMTLLWSLMLMKSGNNNTNNTNDHKKSSSSSSVSFPLISVLADPHLLLWSSYSSLACPDAIVIESANEAKSVLNPQDELQQQCNDLFSSYSHHGGDDDDATSSSSLSLGVVILLVSEAKSWTLESLLDTCENVMTKNSSTKAFSIWIDSHECADLLDSLSNLGKFSMLQWMTDARRIIDINNNNDDDSSSSSLSTFAEYWITKSISSSAFPVPMMIAHDSHHHRRNIIKAATASFDALKASCSSICSNEFCNVICNNNKKNLDNDSCCWMGLLSFVTVRLPDIVPTYSQAVLSACAVVISPQERKLSALRAAASPLPPGISMAPDTLYLYRLGEQIPSDFFFAFWTRLLLSNIQNNNRNNNNSSSEWKPDLALVKMNSAYQSSFGGTTMMRNLSSAATTSSSLTSISSSTGMCRAFSFVLSSWCEENVKKEQQIHQSQSSSSSSEQLIEESVGRLKSVADVIDRHRTVEMRAFQQTVSASKMELKALIATLSENPNSSQKNSPADNSIQHDDDEKSSSSTSKNPYINAVSESCAARDELSQNWRNAKSFAKKNFRAVMIVLQQVGQVFSAEAKRVVSKLLEGGRGELLPMIVLRMRAELEMVASYYDMALNTAVKALGVKGKRLLWVSDEFQQHMKIIRDAL